MAPLADMIPAMTDADLKALRLNAVRLLEHGSAVQMTAAGEILPLIDARLAELDAAPKPETVKKRAAPKKKLAPATGHQTALPTKAA